VTRDEFLKQLCVSAEQDAQMASEVARKIALVAGAGCWALRTTEFRFPDYILYALALLAAFFVVDVFHYFLAGGLTSHLFNLVDARINPLEGDDAQRKWNKYRVIITLPYCAKLIILVAVYAFMAAEIFHRIPQPSL
jgi:hypothetical protein